MRILLMMNDLQNIDMKYCIAFLGMLLTFATLSANEVPKGPERPFAWASRATMEYDFCDTCGCGGNGGSMGFGTGLNNNFVGIRYIGQQYRSRDGIFANSPWIDENFNTIQAWGRFPITDRITVNTLLPYHAHNRQYVDGSEQEINGLGDATLLAFYKLVGRHKDSLPSLGVEHSLYLGGGVKMPTGKFDEANLTGSVNPSFQVGTGSWDYLLAANYGATYADWGLTALLNYTVKTENDQHYRFGNQWNYALNVYRTYYLSTKTALTPQIGGGGEHFEGNREYDLDVPNTGGDVFFARVGLEASYGPYALGVSSMLPLDQDLNAGKVEVKNRFSVYFNINI